MGAQLNNQACADTYTPANTTQFYKGVRLNLIATNNSVFLTWTDWDGNDSAEEFYPIGKYSFDRKCAQAKVRNAVAGGGARFSVSIYTASEIGQG